MKDYNEMSDAEIAQKVFFWVNGKLCPKGGIASFFNGALFYTSRGGVKKQFDPCNNPADAWPIIVDKKIGLKPVRWDEWRAEGSDSCGFVSYARADDNPLRAAMIVFMMMQDEKNG